MRVLHDVFYQNLGKKSKLSWLLIMKVEIFSFLILIGCVKAEFYIIFKFVFMKTQNGVIAL